MPSLFASYSCVSPAVRRSSAIFLQSIIVGSKLLFIITFLSVFYLRPFVCTIIVSKNGKRLELFIILQIFCRQHNLYVLILPCRTVKHNKRCVESAQKTLNRRLNEIYVHSGRNIFSFEPHVATIFLRIKWYPFSRISFFVGGR